MAQSPEKNAGTSQIIRYDLGWNAINAMLRAGRSLSGHERNCFFLNTRGQRFANGSAAIGLDFADDGRVLSLADWDYDGDVDLWLANRSGPQVRYLRNNHASTANRIAFHLTGTNCNRDAIGARIVLRWNDAPDLKMIHTVRSSDGYLSQSSRWVHFGLGERQSIDSVDVIWPNGSTQTFSNIAANRWYRVKEGEQSVETWQPPKFNTLSPKNFAAPSISDKARIVLLNPIPLPELQYATEHGRHQSATDGVSKVRLVSLWATWCQPCLNELTEWKEHANELSAAGIEVIAVNGDERDAADPQASITNAAATATKLDLPFGVRYADTGFVERLDAIQRGLLSRQRPLPLPSSFMVDNQGRLRVIYKGPVDVQTLIADAKLVDADANQVLNAAMPFTGRWLNRPSGSTPLQLAVKLIEGDYQEDARRYIERLVDDPQLSQEFASSSLLNLLGALALDRKEFQSAANAFSRSLKLEPTNRTANIELGTLLLGINKGAAAEKHFRFVLKATPDDPELHYKLGMALLQQNKANEAGRQMQRVLKLRPEAMAYWQLGEIYVQLQRLDRAVAAYEKAISLKPGLVNTANNLAWILATSNDDQLRHPSRALELAKSICESSQSPDANQLDTLAAAHAATGDYSQAVATANRAINIAKSNTELANQIAARIMLYRQSKPYRE